MTTRVSTFPQGAKKKKKTKDKIAYSTDKDGRKIRLFKSDGVEIK